MAVFEIGQVVSQAARCDIPAQDIPDARQAQEVRSYAGDVLRQQTLPSLAHSRRQRVVTQAKREIDDAADRVGSAHGDESGRRVRLR